MENFLSYSKKNSYSKYGGLKKKYQDTIREDDVLISTLSKSGVMNNLKKMVPPSDDQSINEIHDLLAGMREATQEEIEFAQKSESQEIPMYAEFFNSIGIPTTVEKINEIMDYTNPIMYYFKGYFDRARPQQLADKNGIEFEVLIDHTADHPSYPSGHYYDSLIIEHVFSKIKPSRKRDISEFCRKMGESRNYVGLHYVSDNDFSKILAKEVINTGLIDSFGQ